MNRGVPDQVVILRRSRRISTRSGPSRQSLPDEPEFTSAALGAGAGIFRFTQDDGGYEEDDVSNAEAL